MGIASNINKSKKSKVIQALSTEAKNIKVVDQYCKLQINNKNKWKFQLVNFACNSDYKYYWIGCITKR